MKKFFSFLNRLFYANASVLIQYRLNFFMGIFSSFLWVCISIISIIVLTYRAPTLGGWNRTDLILVQGIYSIIFGIMYMVFVENFSFIPYLVRTGDLDFVFLKPLDSQILISFSRFRLYAAARIIAGIAIAIYALMVINMSFSFMNFLLFILFMISGLIIIYSLWFMIMTLSIWFVDLYNLSDALSQVTSATRFPLIIVREISQGLMYVLLPLVVITTVPAQVLLNTLDIWLGISSLVIACVFFLIARRFWKFALRHYTSASS